MEDFQENIKTLLNDKEEIKKIAESTGQGIEATTKILEKILETPDISEQAKNYDEAAAADMAARMGKNATEADIENVANKMDSMNRGPLAKVWDKVTQLWKAFKSPETPASMKAIIIGGLIYMVSPIDLIPDAIPVVGLLDDVGVIGLVFSQFLCLTSAATAEADSISEELRK